MLKVRERSRNTRRTVNSRFKPSTAASSSNASKARDDQKFLYIKLANGKTLRFWVPPGFTVGESYKEPTPEPEEPEEECPVCFTECTKEDQLKCGHYICQTCLGQIVKPECPICRAPIEAIADKPQKPEVNPYPGEADWQTRQILISQFLNYILNPNDIYDTYRIFFDINPKEEVPDVDQIFMERLSDRRIVPDIKAYVTEQKARGRKADTTGITTYTQEYYRLRQEEEVYDTWVTHVPGEFNDLVKKAAFQGLRRVDPLREILVTELPPIPTYNFLVNVSHGQANFARGIQDLERVEI